MKNRGTRTHALSAGDDAPRPDGFSPVSDARCCAPGRAQAGSTARSARWYAWPAYWVALSVRARSAIHRAAVTHATATASSPHSSGVSRSSSSTATAATIASVRAPATMVLAMANLRTRTLSDGVVRTRQAMRAGGTETRSSGSPKTAPKCEIVSTAPNRRNGATTMSRASAARRANCSSLTQWVEPRSDLRRVPVQRLSFAVGHGHPRS